MKNGIIEMRIDLESSTNHQDFFEIRDREELRTPRIQKLLERNHRTQKLCCACRSGIGIENLVLEPRRIRNGFTLARENISAHAPNCFLRREYDGVEISVHRPSDILGPLPDSDDDVIDHTSDFMAGGDEKMRKDRFSRYARSIISKGFADAFLLKNRGQLAPVSPPALQVLQCIEQAIFDFRFSDCANGFEAARLAGGTLRIGLVYENVHVRGASVGFNVYWFKPSGFSSGLVAGEPAAMSSALDGLKIYEHHRAPPFLLIAVQTKSGWLQRVYLHQIFVEANHLVSVASTAEAKQAHKIISNGGTIISVIKKEDFERVLAEFGFRLPQGEKWKYRPDFLVLTRGHHGLRLHIREVRGFTHGAKPDYDKHLDLKKEYYSGIFSGRPDVDYKEMDGTQNHLEIASVPPDEWPATQWDMEAPAAGLTWSIRS